MNATIPGSWVLVEPGTYDEEVKVTKEHSRIYDPWNGPQHGDPRRPAQTLPAAATGSKSTKRTTCGSKTSRCATSTAPKPDGAGGNEIWWNGGTGSGKIGAHGWYGRYLTAYDTGLNGGYGIFTNNETDGVMGKHLRVGLQRLGHVPRRVPGMQGADQSKRRWKTTRSATRARTPAGNW